MKKLLVTGASGLVGSHILRRAAGRFETAGTFRSFQPQNLPGRLVSLDLFDAAAVAELVGQFQPDIVVHCAAEADADRCQSDPAHARRLNVETTATLARLARQVQTKFVFLSTDLIFDGRKNTHYVEADPPGPLSVYAQTKVEAEQAVRAEAGEWLITRSSLVFGPSPRGNRGIDEKLGAAIRRGQTLKLFVDEFRAPIAAANLAAAILELADSPHTGVFHLVGGDLLSRYEIATTIAWHFGWPADLLEPVHVADVPMNPPRPGNLALSTEKARALLKTRLMGLRDALELL